MELTFAPKGILQIDDARICYRNFKGEAGKFNRDGDRNFSVIIPNRELADKLVDEGWNVKIKEPRNEEEEEFITLPVKVKFNAIGPHIYVRTGKAVNKLNEDSVSDIDDLDISSVSMDIRPYDWEMNGSYGRSAYLQSMEIVQNIDRFAARYAAEESPRE